MKYRNAAVDPSPGGTGGLFPPSAAAAAAAAAAALHAAMPSHPALMGAYPGPAGAMYHPAGLLMNMYAAAVHSGALTPSAAAAANARSRCPTSGGGIGIGGVCNPDPTPADGPPQNGTSAQTTAGTLYNYTR